MNSKEFAELRDFKLNMNKAGISGIPISKEQVEALMRSAELD